jgi:hypothetical protein
MITKLAARNKIKRGKNNVPTLTPTMKKAFARAIELIEKAHVQGQFMIDKATGDKYEAGWEENGKKPAVCAVGGMQRAAWELLGKPDMGYKNAWSFDKSDKAFEVEILAEAMQERVNFFVERAKIEPKGDPGYHYEDIVDVNDGLPARKSKQTVLDLLRKAGNLG